MANRCIVVVSPADDLHALAVKNRLETLYAGSIQVSFFDTATSPIGSTISWASVDENAAPRLKLSEPLPLHIGAGIGDFLRSRHEHGVPINPAALHSVWIRRARGFVIDPDVEDEEIRSFCRAAARAMLGALTYSTTNVFNAPNAEERACNKPFQLVMARRAGLRIPETLITSDPGDAERFVRLLHERGRQVIHKLLANSSAVAVPTRIVSDLDLPRLRSLRFAAAIFQERIMGGANVRVVIVGKDLFTAIWASEEDLDPVDIRLAAGARMRAHTLDEITSQKLLKLHSMLGLEIGVYDLKYGPEGECYFFEVNPSGQWLDVESEAGRPISEALAFLLAENDHGIFRQTLPALTNRDIFALQRTTDMSHLRWVRHV